MSSSDTLVVVIHARMGSARFPGKMLQLLDGYPVLEWVLRRSLGAESIDSFVLATSDLMQDDVIADLGRSLGINVFRGSHDNVLQRVILAAEEANGDAVVRICADNPFVSPDMLTTLTNDFRNHRTDYSFNHRPGLGLVIADGFGGEVFDLPVLRTIDERFNEPRYREHLTSAYWEHRESFNIRTVPSPPELADDGFRFDVDTPKDLEYLNFLVDKGRLTMDSSAVEIMRTARDG